MTFNKNDMQVLRIEEAIARAKRVGNPIQKTAIAEQLWPDRTAFSQRVNMTNLLSGRTTRIKPEWVPILCQMLNCSADFLFGLTNE